MAVELRALDRIVPFVRMMRIKRDLSGTGKWQDFDHVFTLITAGSADFIIDSSRYSLSRGGVILIPPFKTHVIAPVGGERLEQRILHFDFFEDPARRDLLHEDVLERDLPKLAPERERIMAGQTFVASLDEARFARFEALYDRMYAEFRDLCAGGGCPALIRAYCTELLVESLRSGRSEQPRPVEVRSRSWLHIENALAFINAHLSDEDLGNERIGEAIGVSPNYLTKRFRACFGMPLHRYVVRQRIELARQLLVSGHCNITEAAASAGFSSIHVFSKTFKSVLGMTPSAYLESIAEERAVMRGFNDRQLSDREQRAPSRPAQEIQTGGD